MTTVNWRNLAKDALDPTTISAAIDAKITNHNDDPEAHLGADQALESHRAAEIIDHRAGSVVNDKLAKLARRFVAIVDPKSESDFDTIESAVDYARGIGGGDIFIKEGNHFIENDIAIPLTIGLYGAGYDETLFISNNNGGNKLSFYDTVSADSYGGTISSAASGQISFNIGTLPWASYVPRPGMIFKVYGLSTVDYEIDNYNSTTGVLTLKTALATFSGSRSYKIVAGVHLINGSSTSRIVAGSWEDFSLYSRGMSFVDESGLEIAKTLDRINDTEFELVRTWTGADRVVSFEFKQLGYMLVNVSGLGLKRGDNAIIVENRAVGANITVSDCKNFSLNEADEWVGGIRYNNCVFDFTDNVKIGQQVMARNYAIFYGCTFLAMENDADGLICSDYFSLINCKFVSVNYERIKWFNGSIYEALIMGCSINRPQAAIGFDNDGVYFNPKLRFINNSLYFGTNSNWNINSDGSIFTGNTISGNSDVTVTLTGDSERTIFNENHVKGTIVDNGTDNIVQGNSVSGGSPFKVLANTATALGLRFNDCVQLSPNSSRTLTTTIAPAGQMRQLIILTGGTTSFTITFGTGFKTTGSLATGTTAARRFVFNFISDGTRMIELSRTVAIV